MSGKQVYIQSLEASDIYSHVMRDYKIKPKYVGMIPHSLELIKLKKEGLTIKKVKTNEKEISDDIINVKFNRKVVSGVDLIERLSEKINGLGDSNKKYQKKLNDFILEIKSEMNDDKWLELSNEDLRQYLYLNGFTISTVDEKTGEIFETRYVVYKRSSSKSRTGQCLFIKEELYEEMINWSRMYLPFEKGMKIDYASLLAYESLVGSSLEDTIIIEPKNILIVDDVESKFYRVCNSIRKNGEFLDSVKEKVRVVNSLFDGESLLSSDYFEEGQSMKLLRNHMFKSAAFNCNIQQFLKDYAEDNDIDYHKWEIDSMFDGEKVFAKDIHLIITPSSLKALKFSHVIGTEKQMWNYWKDLIKKEQNNMFGVCKHEKQSKRGTDSEGNILQQTSYQMINCLPLEKEDIGDIVSIETDYIHKLKNDDEFFIEHILKDVNDINSNQMFADLYMRNSEIANTKIFRDFRKAEVSKYVTHVKKGKVRLRGDYCVLLGNPMEYLYHAIGKFDLNKAKLSLKENEVYTTLFDFNKEYIAFRNPNTSPSNVLIVKNTYKEEIESYFTLTDNIVCVNAVEFEIQDILSGCDYDSDTMVLFNSDCLLQVGKKCFKNYLVCVNHVESQKNSYELTNTDMCKIDNQLSTSQKNIGRVVNLGQLCMSIYWDQLKNGASEEELQKFIKNTDVMTVLSTICIDLAKKFYEIDIEKEIKNVESQIKDYIKYEIVEVKNKKGKIKQKQIKKKPMFFKYVSQSKTIKNKIMYYGCPMDYLYGEMSGLKYATQRDNVEFTSLLERHNISKGNRKQEQKILNYVERMCEKINGVNASNKDEEEKNNEIIDIIKYYNFFVQKLTVKPDTMYAILIHMIKNKSNVSTKLLNILHTTQKDVFLDAFKLNTKSHTF